jgi:hypothetical protein
MYPSAGPVSYSPKMAEEISSALLAKVTFHRENKVTL